MAAEQPTVRILNGTYQGGLEETTAAWLREQGFNVVEVGSTSATTVSSVILQGTTSYGLKWLVDAFGLTVGRIEVDYTPGAMADLILTLGDDWAANNPIP